MRHAVFVAAGRVEWRETADPLLQSDRDAIVRPIVVGRCDLDVAYMRGLLPMPSGAPIGHEIIAEVVAIGDDAGRIIVGDRVFVPAQISCGDCRACRRGATGRCSAVPFAASYGMGREGGYGGGLADLVRVPFAASMLTPLPPGADPVALVGAADMAADAWRAVGPQLSRCPDARVLVLGGMPSVIGLYAAGMAVALGGRVDYVDRDLVRRGIAQGYGATVLSDEGEAEGLYDVVVVADPSARALEAGFMRAAPAGFITSVTPAVDAAAAISTSDLYHRGVTWAIGRPDCRAGHGGVMHAWSSCGFRPDHVPTQRVAWDDAPHAWASDALYVAAVRS